MSKDTSGDEVAVGSKAASPTPVKGHPGVFRKGNRYQVRYRHHGTQRAKSFRTQTEAKRFKAKVDSGDTFLTNTPPQARAPDNELSGHDFITDAV
jgi:hypothetical protein